METDYCSSFLHKVLTSLVSAVGKEMAGLVLVSLGLRAGLQGGVIQEALLARRLWQWLEGEGMDNVEEGLGSGS